MASRDSQINKPQCGHPKRAELPDLNINTGVQSINTERACLDDCGVILMLLLLFLLSFQPVSNADFIVPVEIDGTVHQVSRNIQALQVW